MALTRSPHLARSGHPWRLEFNTRLAKGAFLPILSDRAAHQPVAGLGIMSIDPLRHLLLPLLFPDTNGIVTLTIPMPKEPSLVGVEIHAQALMVEVGKLTSSRFTNLVTDRVFVP